MSEHLNHVTALSARQYIFVQTELILEVILFLCFYASTAKTTISLKSELYILGSGDVSVKILSTFL